MLKAVLCNVSKRPFALVEVDEKTRTIKFAGAYTVSGKAVNVAVNKLTASKRVLNSRDAVNLIRACYHEKSGIYYIDANQGPAPYIF